MNLNKLLKWVNDYYKTMHNSDKKEAEKMLNEHLEEADEMIEAVEGDFVYVEMFKKDKQLINQALELIK